MERTKLVAPWWRGNGEMVILQQWRCGAVTWLLTAKLEQRVLDGQVTVIWLATGIGDTMEEYFMKVRLLMIQLGGE